MLELAILGLLEEQDLHGYEIRRRLRDGLGLLANVSFGSLYPALARLERAGAVETSTEGRHLDPTPPLTGSLSGERAVLRARRREHMHRRRARKVYRITTTGSRVFAELLAGGGGTEDARSFSLRWAFAGHLAPTARRSLVERRRARLVERREEIERSVAGRRLDPYARSVVEHTAEVLEHDIRWLERLYEGELLHNELLHNETEEEHSA